MDQIEKQISRLSPEEYGAHYDPEMAPDYRKPYELMLNMGFKLNIRPPVTDRKIRKLLFEVEKQYFPEECPRCHKPYRAKGKPPLKKPKQYLVLLKNPDQLVCVECVVEIMTPIFREAFRVTKEEKEI